MNETVPSLVFPPSLRNLSFMLALNSSLPLQTLFGTTTLSRSPGLYILIFIRVRTNMKKLKKMNANVHTMRALAIGYVP